MCSLLSIHNASIDSRTSMLYTQNIVSWALERRLNCSFAPLQPTQLEFESESTARCARATYCTHWIDLQEHESLRMESVRMD
jgi:hypothetical protein